MSGLFLDTRGGRLALYLGGDLQFDRDDERLYHEPLAWVPAALAARRFPDRPLRALILGGGDGLALREVLRAPAFSEARLVERDPEVLALGRGAFAGLNAGAFEDPRAKVVLADARDVLPEARRYHLVIYDLTYPGDMDGASLFQVRRFVQARKALVPGGLLALNAVSPETTPEAFACVGASLAAAGLAARPYACEIPSFLREGYGRWGFFYASTRPVADDELLGLDFPEGACLDPRLLLERTRLPEAFRALSASPNRTDELLYYICNGRPLPWKGPFVPADFRAGAAARGGPRLTVAQGFARWLAAPEGSRSLEDLLACLPASRREQTRQVILEWSHHAEVLFREVDLKAFVDTALKRASRLPREWVRELRRLKRLLAEGLPDMRTMLEQAWRVFAVFLLALLLANLCFPDNLYAKGGYSSHYGGGSGGDSEFVFSSPSARPGPFRYHGSGWRFSRGTYRSQVYDSQGNPYASHPVIFSGQDGGRPPDASLLALSPSLQVLESGALSYATGIPGFSAVLEPDKLRVSDRAGRPLAYLLPPKALLDQARGLATADNPALDKAVADHRKWLEWTTVDLLPGERHDSELDELQAIRTALSAARAAWKLPARLPAAPEESAWPELFPGVHLMPAAGTTPLPAAPGAFRSMNSEVRNGPTGAARPGSVRWLAFIQADGQARRRSIAPPSKPDSEDLFVFALLYRRLPKDESLRQVLVDWAVLHGREFNVDPASLAPPRLAPPGSLPPGGAPLGR